MANLRGGGEYGEAWHQAGHAARRSRTSSTTSSPRPSTWCARGTRQPAQLAINGGSNGGLLVGAAMTQRPELFGAVVCAVPLLDMVRYHQFGSGRTWVPEYGIAGRRRGVQDPVRLLAVPPRRSRARATRRC